MIGFDEPDSTGAARAREILKDLYRPHYLFSTPFVWTSLETAELIKYASNAFLATGDLHGVEMNLLKAVVAGNEAQKEHAAAKVRRLLGGSVFGKTVAILGVAFKAETDDIRESPAITVVRHLLDDGAAIHVHDPKALDNFKSIFSDQVAYFHNEFECLTGADR